MHTLSLEEFVRTAERVYQKAREEGRLIENPSDEELRALVEKEPGIRKTIYGNYVAESEPTSRSAMFTKNSVDDDFGSDESQLLDACEKVLGGKKLISVDRLVGNRQSDTTVRLIVPEEFAHVAFGGRNLFYPPAGKIEEPTYRILFFGDEAFEPNKTRPLSQKDITIRLAMLDDGRFVKIIRNGNYIGEYKKGIFAAEDWAAKARKGGIFLHGGCREDYLLSAHGDYRKVRSLIVALSANGKTTLTCKILARKGMEKSWLIQDDGGTLMPDGAFHGFEGGGIFAKTEGVNAGEQAEIFYALLKPDTLHENVYVTEDGEFDLYNFERTSNGRAVVCRKDFMHASPYIDVDKIDNVILVTRGSIIPAISKLTLEQAAFLMVVGQAMESSAGDPSQAGKIRSEFFYDPFIAGNRADHANRFYEIVKGLPDLNFYLINTGWIGTGEYIRDISVAHTLAILDSLLRGGLEDWKDSPLGLQVPKAIRFVDDIFVHPEKVFSHTAFEETAGELNRLRYEAIEKVGSGLNPEILKAFGRT
jgi:phosphoenolpyruvate carboxykinase (ATP)